MYTDTLNYWNALEQLEFGSVTYSLGNIWEDYPLLGSHTRRCVPCVECDIIHAGVRISTSVALYFECYHAGWMCDIQLPGIPNKGSLVMNSTWHHRR